MEKLAIKIADLLLKKKYIEESMYNIYQYGMQIALEIGLSFLTSVVICCVWGKIMEGIIFFAVFIPLRSYLGGYHMKSYVACYVFSCVTLIIVLGLSSVEPKCIVSWLILTISLIVILMEARQEKKKDAEGKYFYPKICLSILTILAIAIILTLMNSSSMLFLLACTNVLVAVSKLLKEKQTTAEN